MVFVFKCGVNDCGTWVAFGQRQPHAPMCPTCGGNKAELVTITEHVVNAPINRSHGAWLAVVDRITKKWLRAALFVAGESGATREGFNEAFTDVNTERAELGLRALKWSDVTEDDSIYAETEAPTKAQEVTTHYRGGLRPI